MVTIRKCFQISLVLTLTCVVFAACSKMDGTYKKYLKGGEIRYGQKPDTIGVYPGYNRVKVWLVGDRSKISKYKVFWDNRTDSIEVPVTHAATDTLSTIIDNLEEGSYTFEFLTYDHEGNASLAVDAMGESYGVKYVNSLGNRLIKSSGLINGKIKIEWHDISNEEMIGTEVLFKGQEGTEHRIFVPITENETRSSVRLQNNTIQYRSLFLPNKEAIDTFYSDYQTVSLYEAQPVELDKNLFAEYRLPTDAPLSRYARGGMPALWDGSATNTTFYGTEAGSGSPHWFTFDMGVTAGLSKMVYFQRASDNISLLFRNANARVWEVWGSNDPNPDGSWDDSWVKLMDCVSNRPSGKRYTQAVILNDIDYMQAVNGETFIFPEGTPPMRFIRIKVLDTWDPNLKDRSFMGELTLFGVAE